LELVNFCEMECKYSLAVTTTAEPSRVPPFNGGGGGGGMEAEAMKEETRIETRLYDTITNLRREKNTNRIEVKDCDIQPKW